MIKLKVCKINTHDNPTDMMTKPVSVAKYAQAQLVQQISPRGYLAPVVFSCYVQDEGVDLCYKMNLSQGGVY